jgi:predicted N-acetyltransferase YhbS
VSVTVRALHREDFAAADRVFRTAFGTFLGLPDPTRFAGDTDYVHTRFRIDPGGAFAADRAGELVGSVFAMHWGSFGFFGPLSVRPDLWGQGIAQALLDPVMAYFERAAVTHAGLFTFAQSAKHVGLYGRYGFAPRFLTVVMAKPVADRARGAAWTRLGALAATARDDARRACRMVTETLYPGLDLGDEIAATLAHGLGDVVLVADEGVTTGFAVCHVGPGTEAGSGTCYVKFGAVACGSEAPRHFGTLLDACEEFAREQGVATLVAGVNYGRAAAHAALAARGFRTVIQGVAMHRPNEAAFSRPDVFALDDWR